MRILRIGGLRRGGRRIGRAAMHALALAAALVAIGGCKRGAEAQAVDYRAIDAGGRRYHVVRVDLTRADLRLYWKDDAGRAFGSLGALERWLTARGETVLAATNAGIFYRTSEPAGVHVERGDAKRPLNLDPEPPAGEARGNFFYRPGGVFYVADDGTAHIVPLERARTALPQMREATQSGPLLLHDGQPHRLVGRSLLRNAIAVCSPTEVALVMADSVTLRELALFVRDHLHCRDALYLDGTISGLRVPSARVRKDGAYVGMIAVTARGER
jgi:uncharacterized protein YigE (DUF2233 family)